MPDPITARVEPQAPSKEAMEIASRGRNHSNPESERKAVALAIDAHAAAKDAEIERWKREAMAARRHLKVEKVPDGAIDVFPPGARYVVMDAHFGRQPSQIRDDANEYGDARAANGATP